MRKCVNQTAHRWDAFNCVAGQFTASLAKAFWWCNADMSHADNHVMLLNWLKLREEMGTAFICVGKPSAHVWPCDYRVIVKFHNICNQGCGVKVTGFADCNSVATWRAIGRGLVAGVSF